jgi:hypothetical protein
MHDLLKDTLRIASISSNGSQAPTRQTAIILQIQQWPGIKQEPADLKRSPNPIVKQEEVPPSLHLEDHRGTQLSNPDEPEDADSDFRRLKLEY